MKVPRRLMLQMLCHGGQWPATRVRQHAAPRNRTTIAPGLPGVQRQHWSTTTAVASRAGQRQHRANEGRRQMADRTASAITTALARRGSVVDRREKKWRGGWDSNPRGLSDPTRFRDEHVQPLRHLPVEAYAPVILRAERPRASRSARSEGRPNADRRDRPPTWWRPWGDSNARPLPPQGSALFH